MEVSTQMREFLKVRGNAAKTAKATGVTSAYISQSLKSGKISDAAGQKLIEFMQKESVSPPEIG